MWPGLPGKSPYPEGWTPEDIIKAALDIISDPSSMQVTDDSGAILYYGDFDGMVVRVVTKDGTYVNSAYPINVPRNPK